MGNAHRLMQIDAFTDRPLGGNPCAVVFDSGDLSTEMMQAIAREMNLSETAFVMESEVADFKARYFTPADEIPMAGHPTIATAFALVQSGRLKLEKPLTSISLELPVGPLRVDIYSRRGQVERIVMTQKKPEFLEELAPDDVLPVFNLNRDDLLPGGRVQVVSTGTPQLMIPVENLDALKRITVDTEKFAALKNEADFFSVHLFCLQGISEDGRTFARHFASPPDIFEDPFTGSATGGMGAYLWRYGLIEEATFVAEQGHWMNRPGKAYVEVLGEREDIESVRVGGNAALMMTGDLLV